MSGYVECLDETKYISFMIENKKFLKHIINCRIKLAI